MIALTRYVAQAEKIRATAGFLGID